MQFINKDNLLSREDAMKYGQRAAIGTAALGTLGVAALGIHGSSHMAAYRKTKALKALNAAVAKNDAVRGKNIAAKKLFSRMKYPLGVVAIGSSLGAYHLAKKRKTQVDMQEPAF